MKKGTKRNFKVSPTGSARTTARTHSKTRSTFVRSPNLSQSEINSSCRETVPDQAFVEVHDPIYVEHSQKKQRCKTSPEKIKNFPSSDFLNIGKKRQLKSKPQFVKLFTHYYRSSFEGDHHGQRWAIQPGEKSSKLMYVRNFQLSSLAIASHSWRNHASRRRMQNMSTDSVEFKSYPIVAGTIQNAQLSRDAQRENRKYNNPKIRTEEEHLSKLLNNMKKSERQLRQRPDSFLGDVRKLKKEYLQESLEITQDREALQAQSKRSPSPVRESHAHIARNDNVFLCKKADILNSNVHIPNFGN